MKNWWCLNMLVFAVTTNALAQDFITRGQIEYEIKRNNKKIYSDEDRAKNLWLANQPEFDITYRNLVFSGNTLCYQAGRKGPAFSQYNNDNMVYSDLDNGTTVKRRNFFEEDFVFKDSIHPVKWKIQNETRKIAGFECRKAIGVIEDSVYVVAFYCPEIIPQGGPECFGGLPGMILGLAIPRHYATWFATRVELASIDATGIKPPVIKKGKTYSKKELAAILQKKYKETGWWPDATIKQVMHNLSSFTL
jgi:GLPGLI family protein